MVMMMIIIMKVLDCQQLILSDDHDEGEDNGDNSDDDEDDDVDELHSL